MTDKTLPPTLTAQQRLALSRHALAVALHPQQPPAPSAEVQALLARTRPQAQQAEAAPATSTSPAPAGTHTTAHDAAAELADTPAHVRPCMGEHGRTARLISKLSNSDAGVLASAAAGMGQRLLRRWWQRHPVHTALDIGTPLLAAYARRNPYRILAGAAALGAVLVIIKPWRWRRTRHWAHTAAQKAPLGLGKMLLNTLSDKHGRKNQGARS